MRSAEGVGDIDITVGSELFRKDLLLFRSAALALLLFVEADVFQNQDFSGLQAVNERFHLIADHIGGERYLGVDQLGQTVSGGLEGELHVLFAFRASAVAHQHERTAVFEHIVDGRQVRPRCGYRRPPRRL